MKVTNVWVKKYASGKLLGFADVQLSLDDSETGNMVWKGFKLFQGKDNIQIGLPSKKDEQGKKDDKTGKAIYHPVITIPVSDEKPNPAGAEFLEYLRSEVETAYNKANSAEGNSNGNKDHVDGIADIPF